MDKNTAQTVVKVLAVLYWIGAALTIIAGLFMLFGGSALGLISGLAGGLLAGLIAVMGVVFLIVGALYVFVGYGLWKFKNWARITAIVLAVLGLISFPLGTIIGIIVIYLFGFDKGVKSLF